MSLAIVYALFLPLAGAVCVRLTANNPNLRETLSVCTALLTFAVVLSLYPAVTAGGRPEWIIGELVPGINFGFRVEPIGMLFALVASGLWIISSLYSFGYMRGNNEKDQTRFYIFFAVSIAAALAIAFAANMLTLFVFYEVLTLATYPLVTHKGDDAAKRGGRIYLGILLSTSVGLLLPGMIYMWSITGNLEFTPGGVFETPPDGVTLTILVGLFMFGIGKAALMPIHRWLPAAMVAPTPVSALLHAVAVVKAGVFSVLKVSVYLFGIDVLAGSNASFLLALFAAFTILTASIVALTKDNLKARLAYSTVSQLSYVVLAAAIATPAAIIGGGLQIIMHAVGKITLFFCAGAIYTAAHETEISRLDGLGRRMPYTFAAFCIGALSIIGLPPLAGAWSKWFLLDGASAGQHYLLIAVLLISSLLNIAYLMPIVVRGFFKPALNDDDDGFVSGDERIHIDRSSIKEAPWLCLLPLLATAIGCILLFFMVGPIYDLLLDVFPV